MPGFIIEITFGGALTALGLVGLVGAAGGYLFYSFKLQKSTVKANAVREWSEVASALNEKVGLLEAEVERVKGECERCQLKINTITAFNLRLQAREIGYQKRINILERKAGVEITDFNDVAKELEDSAFG